MKTFISIASGPGTSLATAERFAREGFAIVLTSRNAANVTALAAGLTAKGYVAEGRTVDAGDPLAVAAVIADVAEERGSVDVVHYNGASLRLADLDAQPLDAIVADLAVNVGGAVAAIKAAVPGMAERGSGTILLSGGGLAIAPSADLLTLSIGKAGLRALALAVGPDLREKGIRLGILHVGVYITEEDTGPIAEEFWKMHAGTAATYPEEVDYSGKV